ncbi:uncharacterized protein LOC114352620 [Ostrinia furnacalis]|uniref:uncharacterized protein LOC114352620 n=1 Tax=Ostrinia furnacalis TaxID=93504 RepID=UPI00103C652B|nr:uncharacterized protein LOC114352620 [Ostrinia furnacalis]
MVRAVERRGAGGLCAWSGGGERLQSRARSRRRQRARAQPLTLQTKRIEDSAQHTLEVCQAWVAEREILVEQVGQDLSLRAILPRMLESPDAWHAVLHFCEEVMSQKEAAEREREASPDAPPNRRRRPGHRRRHYHLHAPS